MLNDIFKPEDKIIHLLENKGLDGVLFRRRDNFSWLTEGKVNHIVNTTVNGVADLVFFKDKKYCITSKMESSRIMQEELEGLGYQLLECEWYESTDELLQQISADQKMAADVPLFDWKDISQDLILLRSRLNSSEIDKYKWLSQLAANAIEDTCYELSPGMTEYQIQNLLAQKLLPHGVNPQVILVATDERILKYRHPIPTEKKLKNYAMLVICAEKWGLVANATRFVHFGKLPDWLMQNKEKLAKIDITMNLATRPNRKVSDVFQAGLLAYAEVGYPEDWRYLHQGGLTGFAAREYLATMNTHDTIYPHQAFAWNPAIRGIKSEDTLLVGEEKNEFITHTGKWNYIEVEHNGEVYLRPDILLR